MIDLHQGHVTIDGTDISTVNPDDLRARLNVVPQDPYFVPGTVRFNLDLRGRASDEELEAALSKVGLWARVQGAGGLDAELVGSEWSQGERQLLCLARAVTGRSRVLVLDEAMSSVDAKTEAVMQAVVDAEFREATVVAVMHRFTYIERYDRVAVLTEGTLVECDAPVKLLAREGSVFGGLYAAHRRLR
jgi:ATP-binding cassette, subfamily C (CFTR/MRP), member 1